MNWYKHSPDTQRPSGLAQAGAVACLKVCVNLQVLRPSERQWKPSLRQAATTLTVIVADSEVR